MVEWLGMLGSTVYRPTLPVVLLIAAGAAAVLVWGWLYARGSRGSSHRLVLLVCRLTALAAVLWLLAGPSTLDDTTADAPPPTLNILLDTSASMAQTDAAPPDANATAAPAAAAPTRLDAVRQAWLSGETWARLAQTARPRLIAFDQSTRAITAEQLPGLAAEGDATNLFDALARVHATPGDGAVTLVLSDGHDTRGGPDEALLQRLAAAGRPIFAVPVGRVRDTPDLAVQAWAEADFLFDGQQTTLTASLIQRGYAGRRATLELLADDRLIASREVALSEAALRQTFTITAEAEPGVTITPRHYRVRATLADAPEPEAYPDNNTAEVFVQVSRQRIRVALFEGLPYWDTQALARVLAADPQIELTSVFALTAERTSIVRDERASDDGRPLLPLDQATLNDFDVVILGRGCEAFFGGERAALLSDFVRVRGGALVLARGKPFGDTPAGRQAMRQLDPLLPVQWGQQTVRDLRLAVTEAGRQNPLLAFGAADTDAIITRLPGMIAATRVEQERAASLVLLRQAVAGAADDGMAAVVTQRVGGGRVLAVLTDGLWRWGLLPPRFEDQTTVYQVFWSRAIQWLATGGEFLPGQEVSLVLDRLAAEPGEPITATVSTRYVANEAFAPRLRITAPDGAVRTVTPRRESPQSPRYRAIIDGGQSGVYRVELDDTGAAPLLEPDAPLTTRFAVVDRSPERQDPSARPQVLAAAAEATGGVCLGLDEADRLIEHLQSLHAARQRDVEPRYDFARWPVLALIGAVLGAEWFIRRRMGLL